MDKTELALKHFEEELLKDFLFREFDENDDEFILLKRYLPYTLKKLKNSKDAGNIKFLKLLEEYDWETNATKEERYWVDKFGGDDVGRIGKFIEYYSHKQPQLVRSECGVLNGAGEESDADYTVLFNLKRGQKDKRWI